MMSKMKKLLHMAFTALSLLVCNGAQAADPVTITDPYDSEWCFVIASTDATQTAKINKNAEKFEGFEEKM